MGHRPVEDLRRGFQRGGKLKKTFAADRSQAVDVAGTPEDEYTLYGYRFSPLVYKQHYTDVDGQDASFYVLSYQIAP